MKYRPHSITASFGREARWLSKGRSWFAITLLAFCVGWAKPDTRPVEKPASPANPADDACALLTSDEIASVQGAPLKNSEQLHLSEGGLFISQCYFAVDGDGKSVSLRIVRKDPGAPGRDPRQAWSESFAPDKLAALEKSRRDQMAEKITGLGEEAFYRDAKRGGALYVLKGDAYFRVTIETAEAKPEKVQRLRKLARFILKRL